MKMSWGKKSRSVYTLLVRLLQTTWENILKPMAPNGLMKVAAMCLCNSHCFTPERNMAGHPWMSVLPLCSGSVLHTLCSSALPTHHLVSGTFFSPGYPAVVIRVCLSHLLLSRLHLPSSEHNLSLVLHLLHSQPLQSVFLFSKITQKPKFNNTLRVFLKISLWVLPCQTWYLSPNFTKHPSTSRIKGKQNIHSLGILPAFWWLLHHICWVLLYQVCQHHYPGVLGLCPLLPLSPSLHLTQSPGFSYTIQTPPWSCWLGISWVFRNQIKFSC